MGREPPELSAAGDIAWLYEKHRADVYAVALRYGAGDAAFAEDVLQDVFVKLIDKLDGLHDQQDLGGWLYRVTTNQCLTKLRRTSFRRKVLRTFRPAGPEPRPLPDETFVTREDAAHVFAALDDLAPWERVAFCAYHLDEKGQAEIGALLGCSKSYVCKLIQKAERKLRARVEREPTLQPLNKVNA